MKKVRFSQLVTKSGHPESHLLLTDPKSDRILQAAIKAKRVLTVMQSTVGTKTDWAEVGFHPGTGRQYLLFPKSLAAHAGKAVIGIKYDLLDDPAALSRPTKKAPTPPKPHKAPPKPAPRKPAPPKLLPPKPAPPKPPPSKENKTPKPLPPPKENKPSPEVATLKRQIKRAMQALEKGQQVAAFNLLKKLVDS